MDAFRWIFQRNPGMTNGPQQMTFLRVAQLR